MTSDAASFLLGTETSDFLRVTVLFRPYSEYPDAWNVNWIQCQVEIAAGPFRGDIGGNLRTEEIARFHRGLAQLHAELKGRAELTTADGWISVQAVGDGLGHVSVRSILLDEQDKLGQGNVLEAYFGFDQTYLPPLLRQLAEVLTVFPVIGNPDA